MTTHEQQLLSATEGIYSWLFDPEAPENGKLRLETVRVEVEAALALYESDVARVIKRKRQSRLDSPHPPTTKL